MLIDEYLRAVIVPGADEYRAFCVMIVDAFREPLMKHIVVVSVLLLLLPHSLTLKRVK